MRKLKTLFYGITHEHAFGKLETLRRMPDVFEIIGVFDDRATATRRVKERFCEPFWLKTT